MLRRFRMDLHIHSLLSACAEVEMLPDLIVAKAEIEGIDLIALCDHNSAENAAACVEASRGTSVKVLPGIECESVEGMHLLAIFDSVEAAGQMQGFLWERLPDMPNVPDIFGAQMVVTASGDFVRYNERLLATGADATVDEIAGAARGFGGLAVPAHVDKPSAGVIGVLGFVPEGMPCDAVELSPRYGAAQAREMFSSLGGLAIIRSSDAHRLAEIGESGSYVWMSSRSLDELKMAMNGLGGRRVEES